MLHADRSDRYLYTSHRCSSRAVLLGEGEDQDALCKLGWPRKGQVNFYKRTSAGHAQLGDHPDMILLTATAHANAHIGTEGLPVKCWVVLDAPPPAPPPPPPPPICGVSTTVLDRQLPSPHLTPTSAPLPLPSLQRMGRKG